jgi:hypothetical protein
MKLQLIPTKVLPLENAKSFALPITTVALLKIYRRSAYAPC